MTLEPKPPPRKDQEPRFRCDGKFFPLGNRMEIFTPPLTTGITEARTHVRMIGDDSIPKHFIGDDSIPFAPGELSIFDDGGHWLKLDNHYQVDVHEIGDPSERRICGRIRNESATVLLVDCRDQGLQKRWGRHHVVSSAYCLIQNGQWLQEQRHYAFQEFGVSEPIEFDKVRFVLDGLSEFTGDAFSAVHKFSSFEDDPKTLVDLAEYAQHGFTNKQSKTNTWDKPAPLDLRLKTKEGDITFRIERLGRISEYPEKRGWETYCTLEFPKMLPLEEITKMMDGVKTFFDFLFQSSLALRKVWVYSSKQVITGVNFENYLIHTNEEVDLSSVSVPVCWELYFKWPEGFREENRNNHISGVKIKYDDFVENNKNLLGKYLGEFIDVVVHRSDEDLGDFIQYWIQCTYTNPQPLRSVLSVHFPTLEYFAQRKGIETRVWKEGYKKIKKWMKSLVKPLEDDDLKIVFGKDFMESFAEDLAWYRNKHGAHHDTDEDLSWSSEDMQQKYDMLRVVIRFHFLNLLQPDHEELNKKLAKKTWPIVGELDKKKKSLEGDLYA